MIFLGSIYHRYIKREGFPSEDVVKSGRAFLIHNRALVTAIPAPLYPVPKGDPAAWTTSRGHHVLGVRWCLEATAPLADINEIEAIVYEALMNKLPVATRGREGAVVSRSARAGLASASPS